MTVLPDDSVSACQEVLPAQESGLGCDPLLIHPSIWGQVKIGGPEQAPGPHPFHTPVPYPRSIPL